MLVVGQFHLVGDWMIGLFRYNISDIVQREKFQINVVIIELGMKNNDSEP